MSTKGSLDERSALVADVGGTHIRLALANSSGLTSLETWLCADYDSIDAALKTYLDSINSEHAPQIAAVAVAGPVDPDPIELTNQKWSFSPHRLQDELRLEHLAIVNDFTAMAAGIPALAATDTRLLGGRAAAPPQAPVAVIGPGTGLGVSALSPATRNLVPLNSEGGHCTLAATSDDEWEVLRVLQQEFGALSNERVLSGPGLVNLYRAQCQIEGASPRAVTPEEIVHHARTAPTGRSALVVRRFSGWLGQVASDVALMFGARGGIYLAGGMLPKMLDVFDVAVFKERFLRKGRFRGYLEPIPIHLVLNPQTALLGAARILSTYHSGSAEERSPQ
jgi:glucokinase